jgi:hypothetical protein
MQDLVLNEFSILGFNFGGFDKAEAEKREADVRRRTAEARAALKKAGIDVDRADRVAKEETVRLLAKHREAFKYSAPSFQELANDVQTSLLKTFATLYNDLQEKEDVEAGIIAFMVVYMVNTTMMLLAVGLFGAPVGMAFTAVVVAPFVEETARRQLIQHGQGLSTFTVAINVFEFMQYTSMMIRAGISAGVAVTIRGTLAVFHQFLGALQKWGYIRDIKAGMSPEEAGKTEYLLAILFHVINNAFGIEFWKMVFPSTFKESFDPILFQLELL